MHLFNYLFILDVCRIIESYERLGYLRDATHPIIMPKQWHDKLKEGCRTVQDYENLEEIIELARREEFAPLHSLINSFVCNFKF